jgi:hypothetical protein
MAIDIVATALMIAAVWAVAAAGVAAARGGGSEGAHTDVGSVRCSRNCIGCAVRSVCRSRTAPLARAALRPNR